VHNNFAALYSSPNSGSIHGWRSFSNDLTSSSDHQKKKWKCDDPAINRNNNQKRFISRLPLTTSSSSTKRAEFDNV
jgi:hypothetical protein